MEYLNKQFAVYFEQNIEDTEAIWMKIKERVGDKFAGILPTTFPPTPNMQEFEDFPVLTAQNEKGDQVTISRKKVQLILSKNGYSSLVELFVSIITELKKVSPENKISRVGYIGVYYLVNDSDGENLVNLVDDSLKKIVDGKPKTAAVTYASIVEVGGINANNHMSVQPGMINLPSGKVKASIVIRDINSTLEDKDNNSIKFENNDTLKNFFSGAEELQGSGNELIENLLR